MITNNLDEIVRVVDISNSVAMVQGKTKRVWYTHVRNVSKVLRDKFKEEVASELANSNPTSIHSKR